MNRGRGHGARGRGCGETWGKINSTIVIIKPSILFIIITMVKVNNTVNG